MHASGSTGGHSLLQVSDGTKTMALANIATTKDFTCLNVWEIECIQMPAETGLRRRWRLCSILKLIPLILSGACVYIRRHSRSCPRTRILKVCCHKMAVSRCQPRVYALAMCLAVSQMAQAAFMNSSTTVTSKATLPTGGSVHTKPCEFAAGSVMIWDWSSAQTAATITHTIVPHITAYPNGSSVTNNETVLATATLPSNVTTNSTVVVSGFTMYDHSLTGFSRV